jgi:hypothetical protein
MSKNGCGIKNFYKKLKKLFDRPSYVILHWVWQIRKGTTMMFNRSISDGLSITNSSSANPVVRADLVLGAAASGSVELPQRAVNEASSAQQLPEDHQRLNQEIKSLEKIRSTMASIERSKEKSAQLEQIRSRLMLSYKSIGDTGVAPVDVEGALREASIADELLLGADAGEQSEQPVILGTKSSPPENQEIGVPDKDRVLGEIEAAIERIGQLQQKLGRVEQNGYDFLLGLNISVSSLNVARTQVADSTYSVAAASTAVEKVLTNVRAAVAAHGNASADLIRIVAQA